jgi:predicted phage-related endonuclease
MFEVTPVPKPRSNGFILPGSPEHMAMISPSKVAAICGVSRWHSAFETWHRMKGLIEPEPDSDRFRVGHAFEASLAELWRLENPGWKLSPGEVQFTTTEFGFPAVVTLDRRACRGRARRIVELKTERDLEEWGDPGLDGDCPADYTVQVIAQMVFSGLIRHPADLMVMGPFFKHGTYHISFDEVVANWMIGVCKAFWASLPGDTPPPLDDSVSTYTTLRALHPDITPGESVEIPEALASDYLAAIAESKVADRVLLGLKSKILDQAGSAQYVTCNGERVAARQPHYRGGVSLVSKMDQAQLTNR